jgi:SSS family transporter
MPTNFGPLDALIIFAYLAMLTFIGIYFSRRQRNMEEYFLASRSMSWLPVGMSLMAALNSGIDYVQQPSWVIIYGLVGCIGAFSWFFLYPWAAYITIPFYRRLNVLSTYEYLETRFDGKVRTLAASIFLFWRIGWMATAIYVPCMMLETISGGMFNRVALVIALGFVVTLYTMLGGIKAVIWTEVIQFCVMLGGLAIMVYMVVSHVHGGFGTIWHTASDAGVTAMTKPIPGWESAGFFEKIRLYFAQPAESEHRVPALGLLIAIIVGRMTTYTGDQVMIQRFQTTKSIKDARQGFIINALGDATWTLGLSFVGLGLFAFYAVNAKPADLPTDRLVPYFLATMFPTGLLGLVLAATLAASLSSIASAINSCTTVGVVDFYERLSGQKGSVALSRVLSICFGVVGVSLAANVQHIGNLIEIGQKVIQTFTGPLLGIYALGMFSRRATSAGALLGGIVGSATALWVAFGNSGITFYWPTVFGFVVTFIGGYVFSVVSMQPVPARALELTWRNVMRRPIPQDDGPPAAPDVPPIMRPQEA